MFATVRIRSEGGSHMEWYFRVGEKVQGPVSVRRMRRFALQRKLKPGSMVSSDQHHWFRADQVFEFSPPPQAPDDRTTSGQATLDLTPPRHGRDVVVAIGVVVAVLVGFAVWRLAS